LVNCYILLYPYYYTNITKKQMVELVFWVCVCVWKNTYITYIIQKYQTTRTPY